MNSKSMWRPPALRRCEPTNTRHRKTKLPAAHRIPRSVGRSKPDPPCSTARFATDRDPTVAMPTEKITLSPLL